MLWKSTVSFKYSLPAACCTICCCLSSFLLNGFAVKQNCSHCRTQSGQVSTPPSTEPAACHSSPHLDISYWPPAPKTVLHLSGGPFFIVCLLFTLSSKEHISFCAGCNQRFPSDTLRAWPYGQVYSEAERAGKESWTNDQTHPTTQPLFSTFGYSDHAGNFTSPPSSPGYNNGPFSFWTGYYQQLQGRQRHAPTAADTAAQGRLSRALPPTGAAPRSHWSPRRTGKPFPAPPPLLPPGARTMAAPGRRNGTARHAAAPSFPTPRLPAVSVQGNTHRWEPLSWFCCERD